MILDHFLFYRHTQMKLFVPIVNTEIVNACSNNHYLAVSSRYLDIGPLHINIELLYRFLILYSLCFISSVFIFVMLQLDSEECHYLFFSNTRQWVNELYFGVQEFCCKVTISPQTAFVCMNACVRACVCDTAFVFMPNL